MFRAEIRATMTLLSLGVSATLLLGACTKQMAVQSRYEPQGESEFFDDHRVERDPIPGTVASDSNPDIDSRSVQVTRDLLKRGQERYAISCAPCHDRTGSGNGAIVQSGFTKPAPFDVPSMRALKIDALIAIIRDGKGTMAGYRGLISASDRIAIAHYVKVLQLRTHVQPTWLNENDQARLMK